MLSSQTRTRRRVRLDDIDDPPLPQLDPNRRAGDNSRDKRNPTTIRRLFFTYPELRAMGFPWSRVHLKKLIRDGRFPPPVQLSPNREAWTADDIDAHIEWLKRERVREDEPREAE